MGLREKLRGPSSSIVVPPQIVFWQIQSYHLLALPGTPMRLTSNQMQKPVEWLKIACLLTNDLAGYVLVGTTPPRVNLSDEALSGIDTLTPGQSLIFEVETQDDSRDEFIDVSTFWVLSVGIFDMALLITTGIRDQRVVRR